MEIDAMYDRLLREELPANVYIMQIKRHPLRESLSPLSVGRAAPIFRLSERIEAAEESRESAEK